MLRRTFAASAAAAHAQVAVVAASMTSSRRACAGEAAAAAAVVMARRRSACPAPTQRSFTLHRTALTASLLARAYATTGSAGSTEHTDADQLNKDAAASSQHGHDGEGGGTDAVDAAADGQDGAAGAVPMHAPTLRSALPPSAVELPEESFLKCIDKEIMDEQLRLDKEEGPPPVPAGWTMHHVDGTSFIYGRRLWMPPPSASITPSSKSSSSSPSSPASAAAAATSSRTPTDGAAPHERAPPQETTDDGDDETHGEAPRPAYDATPVPRVMERHFLRIQLTARDASLDPECDVRGEHFPFSFFVQRVLGAGDGDDAADDALHGDPFEEHTFYHDSIEARCDVVDGELIVDAVVHHGPATASAPSASSDASPASAATPVYTNPFGGYPGPNLDEAEEEVLDGLQSWLAERGIDDQLGEFVGQYSIWVEQAEYETWLQQLRDYVAA